jgi:hypothetical protein
LGASSRRIIIFWPDRQILYNSLHVYLEGEDPIHCRLYKSSLCFSPFRTSRTDGFFQFIGGQGLSGKTTLRLAVYSLFLLLIGIGIEVSDTVLG